MSRSAGRRRSREEWSELIAELEQSGEAAESFCSRRRLHPQTLQWWRWRLRASTVGEPRGKRSTGSEAVVFDEMRISKAMETGMGVGFELLWGDGLTLRIPEQFDAGALSRLLAVLEAAGC